MLETLEPSVMELFALKSLLLLLALTGRCSANVLPEGPLYALVGKDVTISTLLKNSTYSVIIWNYSDGKEQNNIVTGSSGGSKVAEPYAGRVILDTNNGQLTLSAVKAEDSGDYSISAISADLLTNTGEIKLKVLEPVSAVAIKSDIPEAIEHNSTVVLNCSAKGSISKFSWLNGTSPIVADGKRITIEDEKQSSTVTIANVLRSDLVGPIFCTAANTLEMKKSAPFNLTVHYGPEGVAITPANTPMFLQSGSSHNFSCTAQSSPPAVLSWYHGEKKIENPGAVLTLETLEKLGLGKKKEDYTCRATNEKTKRTVASPAVSFLVIDPIIGAKITGPADTLIAGSNSANLSCMAATGTVESRTWTKDGKPLAGDSRVVFSADKSSLKITPLQKEDNGEYACVLSNPVNQIKASFKLVVNYGPEQAVVKGKNAIEVTDPLNLTCVAASVPPASFTWKFNGSMTEVKTANYAIEKVVYKNTGTYSCIAHNSVTNKTTKVDFSLSVAEEGALDEGLSDGAIAGIVIAILVALGAAIALIIYCRQKVPVESPY